MSGVGQMVNDLTGAGTASGTQGLKDSTRDVTKQYNQLLAQIKEMYGGVRDMAQQGFTTADFQADPGYEFAREQGLRATQNAAGVQGSPFGGNAMMAMQNY